MAAFEFTYYLHDGDDRSFLRQQIQKALGREVTDEFMELVGRPFYEVALKCEIDEETGVVTILWADT